MAAAIGLRADFAADDLRRLAKESRDAGQTRRLLALAAIYEGALRTHAARIGGVGVQTACVIGRMGADRRALVLRRAPEPTPDDQVAEFCNAILSPSQDFLVKTRNWRHNSRSYPRCVALFNPAISCRSRA